MSTGFDDSVPFDAFEMDDVDADAVGTKGGGKLPEGGYKLLVTEVVLKDQYDNTTVECEVIEAADSSLVGRKHFEYLRWPLQTDKDGGKTAKEIILAWCYAAKTTNAAEIKMRQQARQGFNPAWLEQMVGRQLLGFVKTGEYEGKPQAKISGRVWALDNPKGKGIPGWIGVAAPAAGSGNATGGIESGVMSSVASNMAGGTVSQPVRHEQPSIPASDPFGGLV